MKPRGPDRTKVSLLSKERTKTGPSGHPGPPMKTKNRLGPPVTKAQLSSKSPRLGQAPVGSCEQPRLNRTLIGNRVNHEPSRLDRSRVLRPMERALARRPVQGSFNRRIPLVQGGRKPWGAPIDRKRLGPIPHDRGPLPSTKDVLFQGPHKARPYREEDLKKFKVDIRRSKSPDRKKELYDRAELKKLKIDIKGEMPDHPHRRDDLPPRYTKNELEKLKVHILRPYLTGDDKGTLRRNVDPKEFHVPRKPDAKPFHSRATFNSARNREEKNLKMQVVIERKNLESPDFDSPIKRNVDLINFQVPRRPDVSPPRVSRSSFIDDQETRKIRDGYDSRNLDNASHNIRDNQEPRNPRDNEPRKIRDNPKSRDIRNDHQSRNSFENQGSRNIRNGSGSRSIHDNRESRNIRDSHDSSNIRDNHEPHNIRDSHYSRIIRDNHEPRDIHDNESRNIRDNPGSRNLNDGQISRNSHDDNAPRNFRDRHESRNIRDNSGLRNYRDNQESRAFRDTQGTHNSLARENQESRNLRDTFDRETPKVQRPWAGEGEKVVFSGNVVPNTVRLGDIFPSESHNLSQTEPHHSQKYPADHYPPGNRSYEREHYDRKRIPPSSYHRDDYGSRTLPTSDKLRPIGEPRSSSAPRRSNEMSRDKYETIPVRAQRRSRSRSPLRRPEAPPPRPGYDDKYRGHGESYHSSDDKYRDEKYRESDSKTRDGDEKYCYDSFRNDDNYPDRSYDKYRPPQDKPAYDKYRSEYDTPYDKYRNNRPYDDKKPSFDDKYRSVKKSGHDSSYRSTYDKPYDDKYRTSSALDKYPTDSSAYDISRRGYESYPSTSRGHSPFRDRERRREEDIHVRRRESPPPQRRDDYYQSPWGGGMSRGVGEGGGVLPFLSAPPMSGPMFMRPVPPPPGPSHLFRPPLPSPIQVMILPMFPTARPPFSPSFRPRFSRQTSTARSRNNIVIKPSESNDTG